MLESDIENAEDMTSKPKNDGAYKINADIGVGPTFVLHLAIAKLSLWKT